MNTTSKNNENSVKALEDSLRHVSADKQRMLLRRALNQQPNDQVMYEALARLTTPRHMRRSAQAGVFINYTRADEVSAVEVATVLNNAGIPVWLDMMHVVDTGDWRAQIGQALKKCGLMLALISPSALHDADVEAERRDFLKMGKLVLPVIVEPVKLDHQRFWQTPVNLSRDLQQGEQQLIRLLTAPAVATA